MTYRSFSTPRAESYRQASKDEFGVSSFYSKKDGSRVSSALKYGASQSRSGTELTIMACAGNEYRTRKQ